MSYFSIHNHSMYSNIRLIDSLNRPDELISYANSIGLKGICLSDHECLSGHVKFIQAYKKAKEKGILQEDFKIGLANEIYLVKESSLDELKENYSNRNQDTKFYHFLLLAKNRQGYEQLKVLSSMAWDSMFSTGFMERVPTFKSNLKKIVKRGDVIASTACFPQGTMVQSYDGLKPIETIKAGELVKTHTGEWNTVFMPTTRRYSGKLITLKTKGSTFDITSTSDHKFFTIPHRTSKTCKIQDLEIDQAYYDKLISMHTENFPKARTGMMKRNAEKIEPTWKMAEDISSLDSVLTPIDEMINEIETLNISKHYKETAKKHLPSQIRVTSELLEVLGLYAAEGSKNTHTKNSIIFTIDSRKHDLINKITSYFKETFGISAVIINKKDSLGVDITLNNIELYSLFDEWFESGAINKSMPSFIHYLNPKLQVYFIKGLFLGDGYHRERGNSNTVSFSTISKQLVSDVVHILHRLWINPCVQTNPARKDKNGVNHQQWYSTEVYGKLAKCLRLFIWENKDFSVSMEARTSRDIPFYYNGVYYMKHNITNVSVREWEGQVYCMNVNEHHSFVAEGMIVHNCLGGELPQMILKWLEAEEAGDIGKVEYYKSEIHNFITFCIDVFGKDNFFFEIQPSFNEQQKIVNRKLIDLSTVYDIDYIVATDGHYLTKDDRHAHKVYLQSQEGDREVDDFYSSTYIMSESEIVEYLNGYISEEEIQTAFDNTMKIYEMIEPFDLKQDVVIPHAGIEKFQVNHIFEPAYGKYKYIEKFANSEYEIDQYFLYLIEEGFKSKINKPDLTREHFYKVLDRINTELRELWLISDKLGDRMSSYYVLTKQIIDIAWNEGDSIIGVSRGSSAGYLVNYLVDIVQANPLDYDLPHFRHLTAERPELPDIDVDSQQNRRGQILQALKKVFGERQVLNIATFGTEGSRSALLSAARGMKIDVDEASYLTNLIPTERGQNWTLSDCFFGNKDKKRKPIKELVNAVNKHEGLMDVALRIENLVKSRSVHASGVYIYNDDYTKYNAMMKASSGQPTTQFDMGDSDYMGNLKVDMLTVQALDRIRATIEMLIEDGHIEWKGSLRDTYNEYLHPEKLKYDDKTMWKKVGENSIPDLFQFDTQVGLQCAKKVQPTSVLELAVANSLMRLMSDGDVQPVDKYILHKSNPNTWLNEMKEYGLTEEEMDIVREHLNEVYGVSESQEGIMLLSMDERISGFDVLEANKLRKGVAKKKEEIIKEIKNLFFEKGLKNG